MSKDTQDSEQEKEPNVGSEKGGDSSMCTNALLLSQAANSNPKVSDTASSWGSCLSLHSDPENLGQIVQPPLTKGSHTCGVHSLMGEANEQNRERNLAKSTDRVNGEVSRVYWIQNQLDCVPVRQ